MNIEEVEFYVDENGEVQYRKIVDEKNDIQKPTRKSHAY